MNDILTIVDNHNSRMYSLVNELCIDEFNSSRDIDSINQTKTKIYGK